MSVDAAHALRTVTATRYVMPLREGGSLPGLVEADDDGMYVMKFRGAGQGAAALVAEVVAGELGRVLGLPVPELVVACLEPELARAEPDPEIQELAQASVGANLGVDFLPGALPFTAAAAASLDPATAADIVWFDALVMNVDRTPRNPNLLAWHGRTWLIDHGAAFYRQHGDAPLARSARAPFAHIREHVLLAQAGAIADADARLAAGAARGVAGAVAPVPDPWLGSAPQARRADFEAFLSERLAAPREFVEEADDARA
jgi:HipA-like protein